MTGLLEAHTRDGSRAALRGDPLESCPWKPGTVGAVAWCTGWHAGRLMRPVARPLAFLATLAAVVARPFRAPPKAAPLPEPCDLFDERDNEERVCAACGVEWVFHETRCGFDEVGAENERAHRTRAGLPVVPFDEEPCDACGEARSHRKHANGGEP